jgi:hypothetical protein
LYYPSSTAAQLGISESFFTWSAKHDPAAPVMMGRGMIACNTPALQDWWDGKNITQKFYRGGETCMQWEYKIVALGLLVDATEPNQREKHEQILSNLGREGWEAFAYAAQSDTVLLKRPGDAPSNLEKSGRAAALTAETT